jgi:hypothetical protein
MYLCNRVLRDFGVTKHKRDPFHLVSGRGQPGGWLLFLRGQEKRAVQRSRTWVTLECKDMGYNFSEK